MNLHRSSAVPDWHNIPIASRTAVQRVAAATYSVITPGNIVSAIGLVIVGFGLYQIVSQQYWAGLLLLAIGRALDIADGAIADATKTKSPLGETVDAVADKVGTLLTIIVLFAANVAEWWVIAGLLIPQLIIPLVIFYKKRKGVRVHPTRSGKLSMAAVWVGIVGLLVAQAAGHPLYFTVGVYVVIGLSLLLGMYALWQYATGRD